MAIYHCSVKTISRSRGQSAVASAAYRSAKRLIDMRTGEVHDFRRKTGVLEANIVTPYSCLKYLQREQIWNRAEAAEKRKNSTVAREIEIALPCELSTEQRSELVFNFAHELAEHHKIVVDVCLHNPSYGGDKRNYHAHLLMTTRRIDETGLFGLKTREWDDRKTGPNLVRNWRQRWALLVNEYLAKAGYENQVDHRGYAEQGLDRIPTIHLGPVATSMERRGQTSDRGDYNRRRLAENIKIEELNAELLKMNKVLGEKSLELSKTENSFIYTLAEIIQEAIDRDMGQCLKQQSRCKVLSPQSMHVAEKLDATLRENFNQAAQQAQVEFDWSEWLHSRCFLLEKWVDYEGTLQALNEPEIGDQYRQKIEVLDARIADKKIPDEICKKLMEHEDYLASDVALHEDQYDLIEETSLVNNNVEKHRLEIKLF